MANRPNVLIVDDIESNRLIFTKILSGIEANICVADSGKSALEKLAKEDFALILLDIQMPEMNGFVVLERIRRNPKLELLPVIFISGVFSDDSYKLKGVRSGLVDFLEKPVIPEVLIGKVHTYLKIHSQQRELRKYAEFQKDFLAKMSHEIRNPMNSILGTIDLLGDLTLPDEGKKWMEVLQTAGNHLLGIIDDILDLSKIEAGELEIRIEERDFKKNVESVTRLFEKRASDNNNKLFCTISSNIPTVVAADHMRIWQVLSNLISNAIKFTRDGTVELTVDLDKENKFLCFEIKDTGIGIPEDRLEDIFDRYGQVDSSIAQKFGGTGLGLKISRELVCLMGGEISVKSKLGQGTSFLFTIPYTPERKKTRPVVLIVDDESDIRTVLELGLSSEFDTLNAGDGKEALECVMRESIDFIVTDLTIPEFDGVELLKRLRDRGCDIPVIIVSGEDRQYVEEKTKTLRNVTFFPKPLELDDLIKCLNGIEKTSVKEKVMIPLEILLVDDSDDNQLLIGAYLQETPFSIDYANNGEEALQCLEKKEYDLVLMDTNMPLMDGNTATKKIRELNLKGKDGHPLTVIALSAYATEKERRESYEAGHDSYLTKPIKKEVLIEAIVEATSGR